MRLLLKRDEIVVCLVFLEPITLRLTTCQHSQNLHFEGLSNDAEEQDVEDSRSG